MKLFLKTSLQLAVICGLAIQAVAVSAPVIRGEAKEYQTVDGWTIHAVWQKAKEGKPTIVLLHGTGQRKEDWRLFSRALLREGYGYAVIDMRGHGMSRTNPTGEEINYKQLRATKAANDYEDMTRDAEAVINGLVAEGVPESSIGIGGAEVGGSIAVKYAAVHPEVPFLMVFSPGLAWQEIPLVNAVRAFKGRSLPILMVYAEADRRSSKETPLLYAFAKNAVGESHVTQIVEPEERGTRMFLKNRDLMPKVLSWIANPSMPPTAAAGTTPGDINADAPDMDLPPATGR